MPSGTCTSGTCESFDQDAADDIHAADIGVAVAGGVEFGRLGVDARFTNGLTNIQKAEGYSLKNRMFSLMVGVRF